MKSETVAVLRQMNIAFDDYNGQMISGDECGPNFLTFVLQLRKNKNVGGRYEWNTVYIPPEPEYEAITLHGI